MMSYVISKFLEESARSPSEVTGENCDVLITRQRNLSIDL